MAAALKVNIAKFSARYEKDKRRCALLVTSEGGKKLVLQFPVGGLDSILVVLLDLRNKTLKPATRKLRKPVTVH
jgi:hypothetical protein